MDTKINEVLKAMIAYNAADPRRIHHLIKVYALAKSIALGENLDEHTRYITELAALTHDAGIKLSEQKYGSASGYYQQLEGPAVAREILFACGIETDVIERVCWLIAHHHTYKNVEGADYQILIEADFLVNIHEDDMKKPMIKSIRSKIFKTETGLHYLDGMYLA